MKVLFVRHAQSENNIIQAEAHTKMVSGELSAADAQVLWLASRKEDPGLSFDGKRQVQKLVKFIKHLRQTHVLEEKSRIKLFTSPMRRACETANAIAEPLHCKAEVLSEMHEVGGIYRALPEQSKDTFTPITFVKVPGRGMTMEEIEKNYPRISASKIPPGTPWDGGKGYECTGDAVRRAEGVATWLRSDALMDSVGDDGAVVLVSHADFAALVLACLYGDKTGAGVAAACERSPDADVSLHSVSERQLMAAGPGAVHDPAAAAAAAAGQEEFARSVYNRYKLSLACSCMLEVDRAGAVTTRWMNDKSHLAHKSKCCLQ